MSHIYQFGEFSLDADEECLFLKDEKISLGRRNFQVLLYLVENPNRVVTKQEFFDAIWADTFVEEANLSVAIATVRKALGDDPKQPRFIENLPRKGYRFIAEVRKNTDEPEAIKVSVLKPENLIEPAKSKEVASRTRGRALPFGIAAVSLFLLLVLGFTYIGGEALSSTAADSDRIDSIAVLPFENQDVETEYISDGLTETIINNLARLPELRVTSRNSIFQYKGKNVDHNLVGNELKVRAILTGRLVKTGNDLLVSVELTDLRENRQVWGQQYLRKPDDIYFVQQQISYEIAKALRSKLSDAETKRFADNGTDNAEAYRFYLKGSYYLARRDDQNYDKAIDEFNLAINIDPAFALPYIGLSKAYSLMSGDSKYQPKTEAERQKIVSAFLQKALDIDPDLSDVYATMGLRSLFLSATPQWKKAEQEYRKAIELNPNNAQARHWLAEYLALIGKYEESFAEYERTLELDPLSMAVRSDRCYAYYFSRQVESSITCFETLRDQDPSFSRTYWFVRHAYASNGRFENAIEANRQALTASPMHALYTDHDIQNLRTGFVNDGATGYWQSYLQIAKRWESDWEAAIAYTQLGDIDKAFEHLRRDADREGSGNMEYLMAFPLFDKLHDDPRWPELISKVGFLR